MIICADHRQRGTYEKDMRDIVRDSFIQRT